MKRPISWVLLLCCAASLLVMADGPDDAYVRVYTLIQQADQLQGSGESESAREKYVQAQSDLKKMQQAYPNWNVNVIQFRLNYVSERIGKLAPAAAGKRPAAQETIPARPGGEAGPAPARIPAPSAKPDEAADQLRAAIEQVQMLQGQKAVLEAKLKEALTAQPAAVDPRELIKAEERIRALEMEKEVLKVALDQEKSRQSKPQEVAGVEELKKSLAENADKLKQQTEAVLALSREKEILETRLQSARKSDEALAALRLENEALKREMASLRPGVPGVAVPALQPGANPLQQELVMARATAQTNATMVAELKAALKALQTEKEALEKTKLELERKLASSPVVTTRSNGSESDQVKRLTKQRDDLQRQLNETTKQLHENKRRAESLKRKGRDGELAALRARLDALEAKKTPYTEEELALFKEPPLDSAKTETKPVRKAARELPRGAAPLLAEAERAFAARRFEEAESRYQQVLRMDDKNVFTLANLAAIQLEQNRLDDAEKTLNRALAEDSTDSHSLKLSGILKFRQNKFDEALDLLSKCVQIDSQDPEAQNYLGITLTQKGQRGAAEAALRKAIQIAPGYGGAHHNLAVVYATQQPPFTELARWHYQKALAAGYPQNAELEKMIDKGRVASDAK